MEIHSVRIEHGPVQTPTMSYSQRQPQNHRPNHSQAATDIYKPSRSPLSTAARYPYPASPQMPQNQPTISQVQVPAQRYPPGASGLYAAGGTYRDYRAPRISLLHSDYASGRARETALPGGAGVVHLDSVAQGQQPIKKIRLQEHKDNIQPLRIDTREQPGTYNPQVEAISPIPPEPLLPQDEPQRTTKDELIQQIGKVDREIAKAEAQISILKKKEKELEEIANKPSAKKEVEEDQPKHQSLPQKIYAENRKKAQSAHAKLDSLGPKVEWPLYNQPSDTAVYHENKRKHMAFKKRLLEYFKKRHAEKDSRNAYLTETYSKLMQEWLRKVEKVESSTKRKAKEAKNREFFEKVFPELRKQREDKERFNRVGARVKSEADMEEIMDNLQEQALEDKKMRSYAVIPPILFDAKERKITYQNDNGFIEDMDLVYKSREFLNIWTPSEKEVFKEKYLQHPKNFGAIASFIERKSVADCVQYYYLSKKTENYKQLLRKSRQRTRASRNNTQKVNNQPNTAVVDILTTGVTTRLQREQQQQRTVVQQTREAPSDPSAAAPAATSVPTSTATTTTATSAAGSTPPSTSPATPTTAAATTTASTTTAAATTSATATTATSTTATATATSTTSVITTGAPVMSTAATVVASTAGNVQPASPKAADNATATETKTGFSEFNSFEEYRSQPGKFFGDDAKGDGSATTAADTAHDGVVVTVKKENEPSVQEAASDQTMTSSTTPSATITETKKKKERRKDKENANVETSDEEASDVPDKSIQGTCIVCNTQLGPHLQSRPLVPSQASQYGLREDQVPPNGRVCNTCRCKCVRSRYTHCPLPSCPNSRGRVKRLRSFPQRLQDLPSDVREPLLAEFHVPSGVTKCCSACFNRIQRRLGPVEEWTEEEIGQLKNCLTEAGANWQLIGERLNKPPHQVRAFYAANRKRLNLESCLGDRKPTLTDEEESGSSTSSCEEPMRDRDRHSSDTASAAESPPVTQNQNQNPIKKEDYDSSATETADEAQTPDHYQGSATITPVTNDGQLRQNASPLSVKDLVLNVIELQLMKNPGGQVQNPPTSGMAPTISSILNNDSNEVTIVSEYSLNPQRPARGDMSLAKFVTPLIAATITPVPVAPPQQQQEQVNPQNEMVVVTMQDTREPETLDLSIKKPREPPPPAHSKHPPQPMHREYMAYHQERKSPAFQMRPQPKLPSPKPANPKSGSITLGTPIITQQPRYEGLLRQMPTDTKMGSITQGTPIHMPHMQEKRVYELFNKRGVPQNSPQPGGYPQYRQPYTVEQQLSSRQIIMNDYITSQMLGRRNDKAGYYPASSPRRTPPPPQQNQQRQGVIQRHTRPYLPPGHEALSSLVDVAVQQPSLPVPNAPHEGLGKTMADNIMEQPHRFQIIQHQQQLRQQQRMEEQRRIAYQHQQQQQNAQRHQPRDSATSLTAASLIDAIITHQINQTSEGGREMIPNAREPRAGDLLFQSFHRDPPPNQQDNNGERPPSVISIDLESDTINKNLTVKELTDSVISHDFSRGPNYYHIQDNVNEQWKRRMQQQQKEDKRSATPQQDERQIIRIAQPQKYHVEPVSPPDNHWSAEQNFRRYQQPQQNQHISALDYVKNRIVEVMRTEDDKKEAQDNQDKERSDSPGEMVIDEEKHDEFAGQQQQQSGFGFPYVHKESTANDSSRSNEPKPLLSAQYEPLSDED